MKALRCELNPWAAEQKLRCLVEQNLSLIAPTPKLRESFESFVAEVKLRDQSAIPFILSLPYEDFDKFVLELSNYSKGVGLPQGFVPHTTFWLIDDNQEIIGISNIRHSLTSNLNNEGGHIGYGIRPSRRGNGYGTCLLSKSLDEAKKLGLTRVLITCGKNNIASIKVILNNGGHFDSEEFFEERNEVVQRYWISLQS